MDGGPRGLRKSGHATTTRPELSALIDSEQWEMLSARRWHCTGKRLMNGLDK